MAAKLSSKSDPIDQFIDILRPIIGQRNISRNYVYFFSIFNLGFKAKVNPFLCAYLPV